MDNNSLIKELEGSRHRRRAEDLLMTVAIGLITLALAAGIDFGIGDQLTFYGAIILWGSALVWILFYFISHVGVLKKLYNAEIKAISLLSGGAQLQHYKEKPTSDAFRWIGSIFTLVVAVGILYFTISTYLTAHNGGLGFIESLSELILICFTCVLAIIAALLSVIPPTQKIFHVDVLVKADQPVFFSYSVRRNKKG